MSVKWSGSFPTMLMKRPTGPVMHPAWALELCCFNLSNKLVNVKLTAITPDNCIREVAKTITLNPQVAANIMPDKTIGCSPLTLDLYLHISLSFIISNLGRVLSSMKPRLEG